MIAGNLSCGMLPLQLLPHTSLGSRHKKRKRNEKSEQESEPDARATVAAAAAPAAVVVDGLRRLPGLLFYSFIFFGLFRSDI